jgi:ATP/maltotriose-dependent transcriptional regulator MalT
VLRRLALTGVLDRALAFALAARAEIRRGRLDAAAAACAALDATAEGVGTPYVLGHAHLVAGELATARGAADAARCACEDAVDRFTEVAAPYDAARARVELARALTALGRDARAAEELEAARATFEHLGVTAPPGAAAADCELTSRELEVLRLVAAGHSDAEIAARLIVSQHTVHRHVANVRTKLRLPSRAAAVAYAARAGLL